GSRGGLGGHDRLASRRRGRRHRRGGLWAGRSDRPRVRFVDTSFWFSLQDRLDRHHEEAAALATTQRRERLLSTNHVVGETLTLIRRRLGHTAAVGFLDRLGALPNLEVTWTDEGLEGEAWAWLRRRDERQY